MTLVVLPEGQQRSGSGSGTVWSHNRYGAYTRSRTVPVNPNTERQAQVRSFVAGLTIAWQSGLTQDQRDAWEVYAANVPWKNKLGQSVFITGFNHFVRSNTVRLQCTDECGAVVRVDDAPTIFNLATPEQQLSCVSTEAPQQHQISYEMLPPWGSEIGGAQAFYVGRPQNPSINFYGGPWRLVGVVCGKTEPNGEPTGTVNCGNAGWPFVAGQKIWIRSRIMRADGRLSELAYCNQLAVI